MRHLVVFILSVSAMGCGRSDLPPLGTVSGIVTLNGSPLANAEVTFQPTSGRGSVGTTDSTGKYVLEYSHKVAGAVVGSHHVYITSAKKANKDTGDKEVAESVPQEYNEASTLTAEVKSGQNDIPFELNGTAKKGGNNSGKSAEAFH